MEQDERKREVFEAVLREAVIWFWNHPEIRDRLIGFLSDAYEAGWRDVVDDLAAGIKSDLKQNR